MEGPLASLARIETGLVEEIARRGRRGPHKALIPRLEKCRRELRVQERDARNKIGEYETKENERRRLEGEPGLRTLRKLSAAADLGGTSWPLRVRSTVLRRVGASIKSQVPDRAFS